MNSIKTCADQLALLGHPMKPEDVTDKVLESLDSSYQGIIEAVNARDDPISFPDLMEKLIQREFVIKSQPILGLMPATAHATTTRPHHTQTSYTNYTSHSKPNQYSKPTNRNNSSFSTYGQKPFLGRCQWCHTKGHSLQKCLVFQGKHPSIRPPPPPSFSTNPQAHVAQASASMVSPQWLLDSGASHHVTQDLANLSLHQPYDGAEEIIIGDGSGLPITHTGSVSFTQTPNSLTLSNVLYVFNMK